MTPGDPERTPGEASDSPAEVLERLDDAVLAADSEARLTYFNGGANDLLGVDESAHGEPVASAFPDAEPFADACERALAEQEPVEFETYCEAHDSWYEVRVYPSETGLSAYVRDVTERHTRQRELDRRNGELSALNDLNNLAREVTREMDRGAGRAEIENRVCELLAGDAYEFAWVGGVDGEDVYVRAETPGIDYTDGVTITLDGGETSRGPTGRALRTGEVQVARNIPENDDYEPWRARATEYGFAASAAVPITHDGETYGALNLYSARPLAFGEREREVVAHIGESIGAAIAAADRDRRLRESERRYRTLAENVPNGFVALFDGRGVYEVVAGTVFETLDLDPADFEGRRITDVPMLGAEVAARIASNQGAALDGERSTLEVEGEQRAFLVRSVPVRDEAGAIDGGITLVQEITERRERERELEHERERLEFVNRVLRHNLLNSLNVVSARLDIVEGADLDSETGPHLDTARRRVGDMIDRVETMRSVMRAIVTGQSQDLERRSVRETLETEVERADAAHGEAAFSMDADADPAVLADDLLSEVFENLLTNAVQHNDSAAPQVRVACTTEDGEAVVRVDDNGPGVAPDVAESVFEKGEKGFDSPGTGFGLYIVREVVESYGGEIAAGEAPGLGGARFTVRVPTA
jgi:PAS domain S-box-containing protein